MTPRAYTTGSHALGVPRRARSFEEHDQDHNHDAYRSDRKLPEGLACPQCHASIHDGRWQWLAAEAGAQDAVCPACRRIDDEFPAGYVSVEGDFFSKHRVEIMNLVENHVTRATAEHPMRRLMTADDTPEGVLLTTTDTHLAREIGDALHDTYGGRVSYSNSFADAQELLRVYWKR